jgi:hypothetical protein
VLEVATIRHPNKEGRRADARVALIRGLRRWGTAVCQDFYHHSCPGKQNLILLEVGLAAAYGTR